MTTTRPQWLYTASWLLRMQARVAAWVFGVILVLGAIVLAVVAWRVGPITYAASQFVVQSILWTSFGSTIGFFASYVTPHIANGRTRGTLAQGVLMASLVTSAGYTVGFAILRIFEEWVYGQFGWTPALLEDDVSYINDPASMFLGLFLLLLATQICAYLIGVVYYRWGGWIGTLSLPLTVSAMAVTGGLALDPTTQWTPWGAWLHEPQFRPLVALVAIAAAVTMFVLFSRRMPVKTKAA